MREQLQQADLPPSKAPIALISAGLMSLVFMGFQGLTPDLGQCADTCGFGHCSADLALAVAQLRMRLPATPACQQRLIRCCPTQCAQCGYPGCLPYETLPARATDPRPSGGTELVVQLRDLMGQMRPGLVCDA